MVVDPPPVQRPPPQKLPRAGQIPNTVDVQPARHLSSDVQPTRQLSEPTISPPDYRFPQQSEPSVPRIIVAIISMVAVLGGLAIVYWWLHR
jgi:hypothetical protein